MWTNGKLMVSGLLGAPGEGLCGTGKVSPGESSVCPAFWWSEVALLKQVGDGCVEEHGPLCLRWYAMISWQDCFAHHTMDCRSCHPCTSQRRYAGWVLVTPNAEAEISYDCCFWGLPLPHSSTWTIKTLWHTHARTHTHTRIYINK